MLWAWASLLIRSGAILAAAELLRRMSRKSSAAYRYRILLTGFALLLIWPGLSAILPEIALPLWPERTQGTVTVTQVIYYLNQRALPSTQTNWPLLIWAFGAVVSLLPWFIGYIRIRRIVAKAHPLEEQAWRTLLSQESGRLALRRTPELLKYGSSIVPLTFGVFRPRILLPSDCQSWELTRRRVVLLHELMHVRRRDLLWQFFANATTAIWWFQPLCWWSRRNLRRESEKACDAWVLASGVRASDYASELLNIAQQFKWRQSGFPVATAMAQRGDLEGRLHAILSSQFAGVRNVPTVKILLLAGLTLSASAITIFPQQNDFQGGYSMKRTLISGLLVSAGLSAATIGGSVFDSAGTAVPDAQASLYNPNTGAKQEAATTRDGKFTFPSLAAGSYILRVEKQGFASLFREFTVQSDSQVERGLILSSGSGAQQAAISPAAQSNEPGAIRVGGEFEQEKLVSKVQPIYPPSAKAAGIQGTVKLDVTVSKDGIPVDIRVLSSPNDDLTRSALEAVSQWRYSSTLLNGQPTAVMAEVIVNYTLSQ
ncbi:MAG TPA: M56 family metallopeptidase [Bryobacteraceae bacterium]|nr:M56 family metallopeptidase [Bryobacteraceae bacterium]